MSRAFANLGLAGFLILAAAFLTRSLGLELHILDATMVSEIDAARLLVHLVGAGEQCVTCPPNSGLPGPRPRPLRATTTFGFPGFEPPLFPIWA